MHALVGRIVGQVVKLVRVDLLVNISSSPLVVGEHPPPRAHPAVTRKGVISLGRMMDGQELAGGAAVSTDPIDRWGVSPASVSRVGSRSMFRTMSLVPNAIGCCRRSDPCR